MSRRVEQLMIKCPNCGRENAANFNFCLDCGYDLKAYREAFPDGIPKAPPPPQPAVTSYQAPAFGLPAGAAPAPAIQAAAVSMDGDESLPQLTPQMVVSPLPPAPPAAQAHVPSVAPAPPAAPTPMSTAAVAAASMPVPAAAVTFPPLPAGGSPLSAPPSVAPPVVAPPVVAPPVVAPPVVAPPVVAPPVVAPPPAVAVGTAPAQPMAARLPTASTPPPAPLPPPLSPPAAAPVTIPPQPPAAASAPDFSQPPVAATQPPFAATQPPGAALVCPACGASNAPTVKFCGNCGKRLDGAGLGTGAAEGAGRTMFMHAADLGSVARDKICKLVTIDQSGREGMTFTIKSGETLCGRVNGIILFFDDPFVSPTHCRFSFFNSVLKVADQGSLNGVYLRVQGEQKLADGEFVRIGRQLFRFEYPGNSGILVKRKDDDDSRIWGSPPPPAFGRIAQILDDGRTGEVRMLTGDRCQLGRETGDIVVPTDGFISGRHCVFIAKGGEAFLQDLGSSNGTYLRVRGEAEVKHGDFLLVGNQMLRVEII